LFGYTVTGLGDVDGDGYDDVAVGAPLWDNGQVDEGAVFIYAGSDTGLSTSPARVLESNVAGAQFGAALAGGGDVNFDGYYDILIGAPQYSHGQTREGRAYVFLGSATGIRSVPIWTVESNVAEAQLGAAVAFADVDGDFLNDVVVGAPFYSGTFEEEGRVSVYLGTQNGVAASPQWVMAGGRSRARFGTSVSGADDFNGDGYNDVAVGAPGWSGREPDQGAVFLYLGTPGGLSTVATWRFEGSQPEAGFGRTVAVLADINDDGFADLAIGAAGYSGALTRARRVFVYFGTYESPDVADAAPPPLGDAIDGSEPGGGFGFAFAEIDVNQDLLPELLVSSIAHTGAQSGEGCVTWYGYQTIATGVEDAVRGGLSIEAIQPNPALRGVDVWFSLPHAEAAELDLLDLAGRRVVTRDVGTFGPGRHHVDLADARSLAPGLYFVRLVQGHATARAKVVVVH